MLLFLGAIVNHVFPCYLSIILFMLLLILPLLIYFILDAESVAVVSSLVPSTNLPRQYAGSVAILTTLSWSLEDMSLVLLLSLAWN